MMRSELFTNYLKLISGRDAIREQITDCEVFEWNDGSLSLDFQTKSNALAEVVVRIPVEGKMDSRAGGPIEILLHVIDGRISALEFVTYGNPNLLKVPDPSEFKVFIHQKSKFSSQTYVLEADKYSQIDGHGVNHTTTWKIVWHKVQDVAILLLVTCILGAIYFWFAENAHDLSYPPLPAWQPRNASRTGI